MYRVVLIDDERFVLASLEGRIEWEEHGFSIVGKAMDAAEGIALIRRELPDVVFTDIKMPGMNGLELIRELVSEFPEIRFVIISGYNEFEYAKQALKYGVLGFCVKPFDENEIYEILARADRQLQNQRMETKEREIPLQTVANLSQEESERFFLQLGVNIDLPHIVISCDRRWSPAFPEHLPHVEFSAPPQRRFFLFAVPSEKSLTPFLPVEKQIGISRTFKSSEGLVPACREATLAYFQKFINGKNHNVYTEPIAAEQSEALIQDMQNRCYCQDFVGAREIFARLKTLFDSDTLTIRIAYRLYQSLTFTGGAKECETYEQLCGLYANIDEMLRELEANLIADITGSCALSEHSGTIGKILKFVNEHYFDYNLSMQTLSEQFGLNSNYISQLFRKSSAKSFTKYLTAVRMEHAKNLLEKSDDPIREIGEKVGYADYFYFTKVFKKNANQTPSEYRASNRELRRGIV